MILTKLLAKIKPGDTLVITSIDRLGRSLKDLISIIHDLKEKSIGFLSLKEKMDTTPDTGMLLFNMMGSIAEFERTLINRRSYDGVKRAQAQGKYKGRAVSMMKSNNYTIDYIARMAKVSRQTLYNWKMDLEASS